MRPATPLLLLVALLCPTVAEAQAPGGARGAQAAEGTPESPTEEQRQRALGLFEQAEGAYQDGEFGHAVELLVEARSLYRAPVLLYNLARAYEGLGELERSVEAYEQYVEEQPDASDRGAIERRIESIERQIEERERLAAESEERERELAEERARARAAEERAGGGPGPWPYVILGAGAVMLAGGAGTGTAALLLRDDAAADPEHRSSRETFRTAEALATTANVLFVAGGIITAAGLTWILLGLGEDEEQDPNLALRVGPTGWRLDGRF